MRPRLLPVLLALLLAAALAGAACGDDDDGDPRAEDDTTTTDAARTDTGEPGDRDEAPRPDGRTTTAELTTDDGRTRTYRLHVPATVGDEPVPLVVALHGGGGSPRQFSRENGIEALADEEGFVVVHPAGITGPLGRAGTWNAGTCCGPAAEQGVDDVAFIRAVVADVAADLPVDPDRVFAMGHSNGAMLAYRLACEAADVFAAVGLQAGALGVDTCAPAAPVSLLHVHGTADTNIPVDGGEGSGIAGVTFRSVLDSLTAVAEPQGCDVDPAEATWPCPNGAEVQLTLVEGGEHGWFGGARAGRRDAPVDVDSTPLIWAFLAAHPRP